MKLRITTPLEVVVEADGVLSIRAEDDSGSFGIQPGHADLLTSLRISVVGWKGSAGEQHYCAIRRGVLTVGTENKADGQVVAIASREAIAGDDLATLDQTVLVRFRADVEIERTERVESTRLQLDAIRRMVSHLQPARGNPGLAL